MKRRILIAGLILSAFAGGYVSAGRARAYEQGAAEMAWYIEDCSIADAHAQRCTIPCGGDSDCVEKNGTRDAY